MVAAVGFQALLFSLSLCFVCSATTSNPQWVDVVNDKTNPTPKLRGSDFIQSNYRTGITSVSSRSKSNITNAGVIKVSSTTTSTSSVSLGRRSRENSTLSGVDRNSTLKEEGKSAEAVSVPEVRKKIMLAEAKAKETADLITAASSERDYKRAVEHENDLKTTMENIKLLRAELLTHRIPGSRLNSLDAAQISLEKCFRKVNKRKESLRPALALVKEIFETLLAEAELHGVNELTIFADSRGTCPRGSWGVGTEASSTVSVSARGKGLGVYFQKEPNPCFGKSPSTNCLMFGDICEEETKARFITETDLRKKNILEKELAFQELFTNENITVASNVLTSSLGAISIAWDSLVRGYNVELTGVGEDRVAIRFELWHPRNVTLIDRHVQGGRLVWSETIRPSVGPKSSSSSTGASDENALRSSGSAERAISSFASTSRHETYSISFMEYFSQYIACSRVA